MAITQDQVDAAERSGQAAEDHATDAQDTATTSRETARQSRAEADQAQREADAAATNASNLESKAAQKRGEADAAAGACQRGRDEVGKAQRELEAANAQAQNVHARYPGECNPDTDAADAKVAAAQSKLQSTSSSASSTCADAEQKRKDAEQAQADATQARSDATSEAQRAEIARDQAELDEETARDDQTAAKQAVADASIAKSNAQHLREEFDRQQAAPPPPPNQPPPPREPNQGDSSGHAGQPAPPGKGSGFQLSSLFDFNLTGVTHSYKFSENKIEKAPLFYEITHGYKHRHTFGTNYTYVRGIRTEEVFGTDTKVTMGGDWRQIDSLRYERNMVLKVETVAGTVFEWTEQKTQKDTPAMRQVKNPSQVSETGNKYESITGKAVKKYKSKAKNKYKTVRQKVTQAKIASKNVYLHYVDLNQSIATLKQEMDEHTAKYNELQEQCKNFTITSSTFVKMIASGPMKLKAGKLKGNIDKLKAVASSLAEFKGTVKLGG